MEQIKLERVNEFEFENGAYHHDAKVTVKVKNFVTSIAFRKDSDNHVSISGTDDLNKFTEAADISLDWTALKEEYEALLVVQLEKEKAEKIKNKTSSYNDSWVHNTVKTLAAHYPAGIFRPNITLEQYVDKNDIYGASNGFLHVKCAVDGLEFDVELGQRGGNRFDRGALAIFTNGEYGENKRWAMTATKLVEKELERLRVKRAAAQEKTNKETADTEALEGLFHAVQELYPMEIASDVTSIEKKHEYVSNSNAWSRRSSGGYYVDSVDATFTNGMVVRYRGWEKDNSTPNIISVTHPKLRTAQVVNFLREVK